MKRVAGLMLAAGLLGCTGGSSSGDTTSSSSSSSSTGGSSGGGGSSMAATSLGGGSSVGGSSAAGTSRASSAGVSSTSRASSVGGGSSAAGGSSSVVGASSVGGASSAAGGSSSGGGSSSTSLGPACTQAETDCNSNQACDYETQRCIPVACNPANPDSCPGGTSQYCGEQDLVSFSGQGECYVRCNPLQPTTCQPNEDCVSLKTDQSVGACIRRGTEASGASCNATDVDTGCQAGLRCRAVGAETAACREACDPFSTNGGSCGGFTICDVSGICVAESYADPAQVGGNCAGNAPTYGLCDPAAGLAFGLCMPEGASKVCRRLCLTASPMDYCLTGENCLAVLSSDPSWGVCQ